MADESELACVDELEVDPFAFVDELEVEPFDAPPAPPVPVESSHAASAATLTARPRDTAIAARLKDRTSVDSAAGRGAPQCGQASSSTRT